MVPYNRSPLAVLKGKSKDIHVFEIGGDNIQEDVVSSFGEEWNKFSEFSDEMINSFAVDYFDIVNESMVNKNTKMMDVGCGTGRWSKYLSPKAGYIEAIEPSKAIFSAEQLLKNTENVRLSKASIDTIPFADESFDFIMSVGVLHHTPNPAEAMKKCVAKLKKGGYFYCYLYHNLETKSLFSKYLFNAGELVRKAVSSLPGKVKSFICDVLAVLVYMPLILIVRLFMFLGLKSIAEKLPLAAYYNKSFYMVRNDSLDKFGTKLEHRYGKKEIISMMNACGLFEIQFSDKIPFYHMVGRKL